MTDNGLWLIVASILLVVLLVLFPVINILEKQDHIIQLQLMDEVDYFIREVKGQGQITREMYEQLNQKLSAMGNHFDVNISRKRRLYVPVYEDPLDINTFAGRVKATYEVETHRDIVTALYDRNNTAHSYYFNKGDYIVVSVKSTLKSRATQIKDMLWAIDSQSPTFYMRLSGMVAHEAY